MSVLPGRRRWSVGAQNFVPAFSVPQSAGTLLHKREEGGVGEVRQLAFTVNEVIKYMPDYYFIT